VATYSECVSAASVTQYAKRMRRTIATFSRYVINSKIFGENVIERKSVLIFSTNVPEAFLL